MDSKMKLLTLILCVVLAIVESISVSPNGNSPQVKMIGGMMVEKGFLPMTSRQIEGTMAKSNYEKSLNINANATKLALNERYRRLIPYMTFYYANDLATPPPDSVRNIEVEKAHIVEAKDMTNERQPKKMYYSQRNIPRYQGNRLTQYNIASANPTKIFYKDGVPIYQSPSRVSPNYNPLLSELPVYDYDTGRLGQKFPGPTYTALNKRPYLNLYNEESPNIRYYLSEKEQTPKYKLVPYDNAQFPPVKVSYVQTPVEVPYRQTQILSPYEPNFPVKATYEQPSTKAPYKQPVRVSYVPQQEVKATIEQSLFKEYEQQPLQIAYDSLPVKINYGQTPVKTAHERNPVKSPYEKAPAKMTHEQKVPQHDNIYEPRKPVIVSVLVPKELHVKPRPVRPPFAYNNGNSYPVRKQPAIVSESYYEKQRLQAVSEPVIESGFKPIVSPTEYRTEAPIYTSTLSQVTVESDNEVDKQSLAFVDPYAATPDTRPNYYQYEVDQPTQKPLKETLPSAVTLASLLNSLQVNKSVPKPITRENVASSIRTLLQVLKNLKEAQSNEEVLSKPVLSTPKPFVSSNVVQIVSNPDIAAATPEAVDPDLHEEPYLAEVNTPSQHLEDDYVLQGGQRPPSSQRFPLQTTSDDEGGTPGVPGVDYPVLSSIPQTKFDCKTQRYKGFFADTETRCQVWHYCDLNGGQASFLCPNGTIFSQAGLTCDWWHNVRCETTTQLYVLNESLYKYILPHSPKFPEDYSGPLVDKYLTLKFKEMEEEFKKNKSKNDGKTDSSEDDEEEEEDDEKTNGASKSSVEMDKRQLHDLREASVIVESPGTSGKVQRLHDE